MHVSKAQKITVGDQLQLAPVSEPFSSRGADDQASPGGFILARNLLIGTLGIFLAYKYGIQQNPQLMSALWLPDAAFTCSMT